MMKIGHRVCREKCYIDALNYGSKCRFINHSHAPNCKVDEQIVDAKPREGIRAKRNIAKGEELTLDYGDEAEIGECLCEICQVSLEQ